MPDRCAILCIDDEQAVLRMLRAVLAADYDVSSAVGGREGLRLAAEQSPDLVILDLQMPDMHGLDVCRELRGWYQGPLLILSVQDQDVLKAKALDFGADDYLTKPFSAVELQARVRALLRRIQRPDETLTTVTSGALAVHLDEHRITIAGSEVRLTPCEYGILAHLARNANRLVTYRMLLERVWGPESIDDIQTLRVHISRLRKKIEPNPSEPTYVRTEPGIGFRLLTD